MHGCQARAPGLVSVQAGALSRRPEPEAIMSELTKPHTEILTALDEAGGPIHRDALSVSSQAGALNAHIDHLASRALIAVAGETLSLTEIGAAILAPAEPGRQPTKKARLIALLGAKTGVTIADLAAELSWQPHTTRAALTGLRKAGHEIEKMAPAEGAKQARYRLKAAA
jgi:hypothetical protein